MPEKQQPIFVSGIFFDRPREGAPEFVKGRMSINPRQFLEWAKLQAEHASDKGYLHLDLLKSRDGSKFYFTVNTYKPMRTDKQDAAYDKRADSMTSEGYGGESPINAEEIPF